VGPIDEKTALLIKLCESKTRADCDKELAILTVKHRGLCEKHIAILRELQQKFTALGFDDFLKILIGILGGFLVREISGTGIDALTHVWVLLSILLLVIGFFFLLIRNISVRGRRREVIEDLKRMSTEESA
jgi:hypothetical protein